jgi:protocatechuate 4,5-dioxygenase beta chain
MMAQMVGGFLIPHVPLIAARPDAPPQEKSERVHAAFREVTRRLAELEVDTIINIGDDHCGLFSPSCVPQCLIAIGDVDGPMENWLRMERRPLATNQPLAEHIYARGTDDGVTWAFASSLTVDHATMIPFAYCYEALAGVRIIPVYLNEAVEPYISNRAARRVGASIRAAVDCWSGGERVAIVGTGGISHWVGMADMGRTNEAFDRGVISLVEEGDLDGLAALEDATILADGGNGALEIKSWICAMAAMPNARGRLIAYENVPEWITGLGFAELQAA